MEEKVQKAGAMSPQKLLIGFSRDRIIFWISVAVVAHIIFISALSLGYIRDTWIDPDGAAKRKADAVAAVEAAKKAEAEKNAKPTVATGTVAKAAATGTVAQAGVAATGSVAATTGVVTADGNTTGTTEQIMDERKNSPIVKKITEKATPDEIPKQPSDLGISIDDTNVR